MSAYKRFAIPTLLLSAALLFLLMFKLRLHPLVSYLIAVNVGTFLLYGLDKLCAIRHWQRAPELLLHTLAIAGGSPGALFGQQLFDHKISKVKFLLLYWLIVVIQLFLLYLIFYTELLKSIF